MVHSKSFLIDARSSSLQSTMQLLFSCDAALAIVAPDREPRARNVLKLGSYQK